MVFLSKFTDCSTVCDLGEMNWVPVICSAIDSLTTTSANARLFNGEVSWCKEAKTIYGQSLIKHNMVTTQSIYINGKTSFY